MFQHVGSENRLKSCRSNIVFLWGKGNSSMRGGGGGGGGHRRWLAEGQRSNGHTCKVFLSYSLVHYRTQEDTPRVRGTVLYKVQVGVTPYRVVERGCTSSPDKTPYLRHI